MCSTQSKDYELGYAYLRRYFEMTIDGIVNCIERDMKICQSYVMFARGRF